MYWTRRRELLGVDAVDLAEVQLALPRPDARAVHQQVREDDVDAWWPAGPSRARPGCARCASSRPRTTCARRPSPCRRPRPCAPGRTAGPRPSPLPSRRARRARRRRPGRAAAPRAGRGSAGLRGATRAPRASSGGRGCRRSGRRRSARTRDARGSRRRASRPRAAGAGESKTSPAMRTASTLRSTAIPATWSRALAYSSIRERPRSGLPTCQSAVWRKRTAPSLSGRPARRGPAPPIRPNKRPVGNV